MQNENGRIVFVDSDGLVELGENGPKTPAEKLKELGTTSAFKSCFSGEASSSKEGGNSQQDGRRTYTAEEARTGKANIKDLAFGKARIEGVDETPRPDMKKVNISEIANLKKRQWD